MKFYSLFFSGLTFTVLFSGTYAVKLFIKNNCPIIIWPATLTSSTTQLLDTGFDLDSGSITAINVPAHWTGRVWARTGCYNDGSGKFLCSTGDCGSGQVACNGTGGSPPATLVEFSLDSYGGFQQDFFDVSLVDGFNLPVSIDAIKFEGTLLGRSGNNCTTPSCKANVNDICPAELALTVDGVTIGCISACAAFNQPQYCCTGQFDTPDTCEPTNYSRVFKNQCPQAYSYAFDDSTSTFSCTGGPDYLITFCP